MTPNQTADISLVEKYISLEDYCFVLNDESSLIKEIGQEQFETIRSCIEQTNNSLAQLDSSVKTYNDNDNLCVVVTIDEPQLEFKEGKNDYRLYWWGFEVWLSKTTVRNIIDLGFAAIGGWLGVVVKSIGKAIIVALIGKIIDKWGQNLIPGIYVRYSSFWGFEDIRAQ